MPVNLHGTVQTAVPGVYAKVGVALNDSMLAFLKAVRGRTGFDIVVTSGTRSPYQQAQAMITKFQMGGIQELYNTYSNDAEITRMVNEYGPTVEGFARALQDQLARGVYMSRHLRADALDFRVDGLSASEREQLMAASVASGAKKILYEGTPPHIHVDGFGGGIIAYARDLPPIVWVGGAVGGVGVAGLFLWLVWRNRTSLASRLSRRGR